MTRQTRENGMNPRQRSFLKPLKQALRSMLSMCFDFPFWDPGLDHLKPHAKGLVLNAGSGLRSRDGFGDALVNLDLAWRKKPQVAGDLHRLPFRNASFDTILNIAVLEHVPRAWECVEEFRRVLKPGGVIICSVPFLQPTHNDPGDYIRFTEQGLRQLFLDKNFTITESGTTLNFFHTVGWITYELLVSRWYLRPLTIITNPITLLLQRIPLDVPRCRSANTVIARKL